jgi:3-oxoacyl-[acyl-carrier-protein] synthase III
MPKAIIIGTGSYIPKTIIPNNYFLQAQFFEEDGTPVVAKNEEVIEKFKKITEIEERRYETDSSLVSSDLATIAAKKALQDAGIDKTEIEHIIVAHNFGDASAQTNEINIMPNLAMRVKHKLAITNVRCKAYDMLYGCPGWLEGLILASQLIELGKAKNILVISTDLISRVIDPHDRNRMIFADGAAAVVLSAKESEKEMGLIDSLTFTSTDEELSYLTLGKSNNPAYKGSSTKIRMKGRKVYEYVIKTLPLMVKEVLDKNNLHIKDIKKIFIHQANAKMDHAVIKRISEMYQTEIPEDLVPMTIYTLGNTSVSTIPTMLDLVKKNKMEGFTINSGDYLLFASVGAGMAANIVLYKEP